jgi:hypothetical protein
VILTLGGVPVPTAWPVFGLRMEERPPAMEVSCECIEYAAADRQQGMVLQLGGWAWGQQRFTVKINLLRKIQQSLGPGRILLDKRTKLRNMDMRFGTWNVRSLYRAGSLMTV